VVEAEILLKVALNTITLTLCECDYDLFMYMVHLLMTIKLLSQEFMTVRLKFNDHQIHIQFREPLCEIDTE
jgi:hypothetical protein